MKIVLSKGIEKALMKSLEGAEWIQKARKGEQVSGAKYLSRHPSGDTKRPWIYVYLTDLLSNPLKKLSSVFGISEKKVTEDYEKENIEKDYGVDKKTFAQHELEYFCHRELWDKRFADKRNRDLNKQPKKVNKDEGKTIGDDEKEIKPKVEKPKTEDKAKEKKDKTWKPSSRLMYKIWTLYTGKAVIEQEKAEKAVEPIKQEAPITLEKTEEIVESEQGKHDNRSKAMKGNDNAKKDIKEAENGVDTERDRVSVDTVDLRSGEGEGNSTDILPPPESSSNRINDVIDIGKSGIGLADATAVGGDTERVGRVGKSSAIKIRAKCREILDSKTNDEITEEDKKILSQYEGAGGLHEDGQSSKAVLTEFYTPRDVIKKVWELVDKYKPSQDKTVLEPSCGTGRFAEGRNEKFTMCEFDETSARIAQILHPEAKVKQGAFQNLFLKNNAVQKTYKGEQYDVAVGNPPYMAYNDKYKGLGEGKIHDRYETYFMDRTLDTLKDGGIMAFVVPASFLRGGNSKAKEAIAKKGKLLEAWRLPKGTFSSTDVGTDIVVIQKGKGELEAFNDNKYFTDNMNHVIGEEIDAVDRFGNPTKIVQKPRGKTIEEAIAMIDPSAVEFSESVQKMADMVEAKKSDAEPIKGAEVVEAKEPKDKVFSDMGISFTLERQTKSGKIHKAAIPNDAFWTWYNDNKAAKKDELKNKGMYLIRDKGQWLLCSSRDMEESDEEKHRNRSEAMKGNDNAKKAFHAERQNKAASGELFVPSIGKNMTAEEYAQKYNSSCPKEDVKFWQKTGWDGLISSDSLTDAERKEIDKNERFLKIGDSYESVVNFASGNIYTKLDELEAEKTELDPKEYEKRKALLEKVLPIRKTVNDMSIDPKSNFLNSVKIGISSPLSSSFERWLRSDDYSAERIINSIKDKYNINTWDIFDYLRGKAVIQDSQMTRTGRGEELRDQKAINRRAAAIEMFSAYLKTLSLDDIKKVEDAYNRRYNAYVSPDYAQIPTYVDGMNTHMGTFEFTLSEQQLKGVSRLCNKGNGILAYDVGLGKTVTGIVATVHELQSGEAKKPMICVPKAVYKNWIKEIKQHFPNVKINELGNLGESYMNKFKKSDGSVELPEGALNICTYEGIERITFKDETLSGDLTYDMTESQSAFDYRNGTRLNDKRSEREKAAEKEKVQGLLGMSAKTKEGAVYFEDLGIDHITVDELHNFKNIFKIPRNYRKSNLDSDGDNVMGTANEYAGIQGETSHRGMKLFAISQLIQRKRNGKGFFGLSATPFNNSPVEIYNILSLVARNRLKEMGVYNMKDFMDVYAEFKMDNVVTANGNVEQKKVMKSFSNLGSLQNLLTEYIDKVDGEEGGVIRPYKQVHLPELELTEQQKIIMEVERKRMEGLVDKDDDDDSKGASTLVAMNNMRMACLSPSLIDPKFYADYATMPGWKNPKVSELVTSSPKLTFVCDSVINQYKDRPTEGQVIYMPRGTGTKNDKVKGFEEVKKYLVKKGLPADSIAFIRSNDSMDKKEQIMADYNDPNGKIKVIIGSETIKEGVNLNGNSTTLYNTMLGWNPTETTQVEGRIWRQGNKQGITHIVYPLMSDSIDAMMYQKYDEKSSRLNALWSYKGNSLNVEDINPEEMKMKLIKNPATRAKMRINEQVSAIDLQIKNLEVNSAKLNAIIEADEKEKEKINSKTPGSFAAQALEETRKKTLSARLKGVGFSSLEELKQKMSDNREKIQALDKSIKEIEEKRQQYEDEARIQIQKENELIPHESTAAQVKNLTSSIRDNLIEMDDDWKARLKGIVDATKANNAKALESAKNRLKERKPKLTVKKSFLPFVIKNGQFLLRKKVAMKK